MVDSISTQSHLDIEDIRNDLAILKNGNVALIMESNAINFELLSEEEQDAKIIAFANLVNSLNFVLQIVVHTERADVTKYIEKIRKVQSKHTSQALVKQMEIYIKFIKNLTINNEILSKRFFIVIPALIGAIQRPSFVKSLMGGSSQLTIDIDRVLAKAQLELYPKRDQLIKLFRTMGLTVKQLNTDELIHLFYSMYDPDKVGYRQQSISKSDYTSNLITPGI